MVQERVARSQIHLFDRTVRNFWCSRGSLRVALFLSSEIANIATTSYFTSAMFPTNILRRQNSPMHSCDEENSNGEIKKSESERVGMVGRQKFKKASNPQLNFIKGNGRKKTNPLSPKKTKEIFENSRKSRNS